MAEERGGETWGAVEMNCESIIKPGIIRESLRIGRYEPISGTSPQAWSVTIPDPQQHINRLNALNGDAEVSHLEADRILLELLCELGMAPVADAFKKASDKVGFWYA